MKIKTFYAKSMAAAMQDIKASLGPDALILSTREIPSRSGLGPSSSGFEVVAAVDEVRGEEMPPAATPLSPTSFEDGLPPETGQEPIVYSPASLIGSRVPGARKSPVSKKTQRQKEPSAAAQTSTSTDESLPFSGAPSISLYQELVANGVHEWLARLMLEGAHEACVSGQRRTRQALLKAVSTVAMDLIAPPRSQEVLPGKRVVVFVGPTGVGKTTSLVKLAAWLALEKRKRVVMMTLDGYRIGAVEQLRTYAGLMGIPFRFVKRVPELGKAIAEDSQRDYILIDTTGRGPREMDAMADLAAFLRESDQMERHLVLSATTKNSDLDVLVDRFEICQPDHLLFTKLDESIALGPILNQLVSSRKSLSYYTDGQRVPEDLHTAAGERLINLVLNTN